MVGGETRRRSVSIWGPRGVPESSAPTMSQLPLHVLKILPQSLPSELAITRMGCTRKKSLSMLQEILLLIANRSPNMEKRRIQHSGMSTSAWPHQYAEGKSPEIRSWARALVWEGTMQRAVYSRCLVGQLHPWEYLQETKN